MDPVDKAFSELGGLQMPTPYWMNHPPKIQTVMPQAITYGPLASEMISDALDLQRSVMNREKKAERLRGQAEGLVIGLLLAGFFGLLLNWSF